MRKSRIKKLAIAGIAACAVLGGIGAANAQMHGGSHAGGGGFHGGGFHGGGGSHGGGSHGGGFHGGGGIHHGGGGIHHGDGFHGFIGPPIVFGPGYYPYGYPYPYADGLSSYQWYCRDPAGYYPDVQTCPSGWLQVVPNG